MINSFGAKWLALAWLAACPLARQVVAAAPAGAPHADEVKTTALLAEFNRASLLLRAEVFYGNESEDQIAIANTAFYLLSRDLIETLKAEKFEFDDDETAAATARSDEDYLQATALAFLPSAREDAEWVEVLITAAIAKHRVAKLDTDQDGAARLKQINPGNYFLFGLGRAHDDVFVWHELVEIKPGKNQITVDQHTAAAVFDAED